MTIDHSQIVEIIEQAKERWGLRDWEITCEYGETDGAEITPHGWTARVAKITLESGLSLDAVRWNIYHELGHMVIMPIWRGTSDWVDYLIGKQGEPYRDIFDEQVNTRENEVIDRILRDVFKLPPPLDML